MAEEKKGGSFPLQSTGIFALALAILGLIWSGPAQLINERPASHMKSDADRGQIQDIDVRMWQDPLEAVAREAGKTQSRQQTVSLKGGKHGELNMVVQESTGPSQGDHSPVKLFPRAFVKKGAKPAESILVLAAMLPGGPYPEAEEARRRKRYAVLSGLATMEYTPEDAEHIGYFKPENAGLPDFIPFELFEYDHNQQRKGVIVLWLNDLKLAENMEEKIQRIFAQVDPHLHTASKVGHAVIGPNKSGQLKSFIKQASPTGDDSIYYYAAGATIAPSQLEYPVLLPLDKTYYRATNLFRTIADDQAVSTALVNELKLRQVVPGNDHVLLISEWDTLYGQILPKTFAQAYTGGKQSQCRPLIHAAGDTGEQPKTTVHCINYMRGIDGLLPDEAGKNDGAKEAQKKADTIQINSNIDRPSGNYQQDYLRRLVERVRKLDKIIQQSKLPCPVKNNGINAIGVLGSDVYDKLMILQALRPYFPGKLFFTTDLDAAFFSERELPYTRNLIIGSSYGLSLAPKLQMPIPPFRDSYQTAAFLSTKLAVSVWESGSRDDAAITSKLQEWLGSPRIFEISSKGAFDLSSSPQKQELQKTAQGGQEKEQSRGNCQRSLLECGSIHPEPDIHPARHFSRPVTALYVAALALGLLLLYRMSWTVREYASKAKDKLLCWEWLSASRRETIAQSEGISVLLFLIAAMAIIYIGYSIASSSDEPLHGWNGISIWPSNLLQLLALLLSIGAYRALKKRLAETDERLGVKFLNAPISAPVQQKGKLASLDHILSVHKWEASFTKNNEVDVAELWKRYCKFGQRGYRFWRAALGTIIYVLFGTAAVMISGGQPVPSRGGASFFFDVALELACAFMAVFLVMWVVDASRLASRLIRLIATDRPSAWPRIGEAEWGWPQVCDSYSVYWMDVEFVARYTRAMENFIWYPMLPLLLLGAARSRIFDNWTFAPGLLAAIIILLVYLFSVAFIQQRVARDMRKKAVEKLEEQLRILRGDIANAAQLEKMISEIKNNEKGAFTPFLHQPLVQALLTFLSGSGGLIVLMERF